MRYFSFVLLFIFSCAGSEVPENVLLPEKMGAVWYDVILADETADFSSLTDSTYRKFAKRAALYDSVFTIHGITKAQYQAAERFYQSRPDLLKEILADLHKKVDSEIQKQNDTTRKKGNNPI